LDHTSGLISIILRRKELFDRSHVPYRPLVVGLNANVRKSFSFYCSEFEQLENLVVLVDVSMSTRTNFGEIDELETFEDPCLVINLEEKFPPTLYSPLDWNLREVRAVHVNHTRMACGYVLVDEKNGRKLVFSGDTRPCDLLVSEGEGADLLIHEATFEDGMEEDAFYKKHSTMGEAVSIAKRMGAKHIILTHFSSRYSKSPPPMPDYLIEAGNISLASDFMVAKFNDLEHLPKLLPLYKQLYSKELSELEDKMTRRELRKANDEVSS